MVFGFTGDVVEAVRARRQIIFKRGITNKLSRHWKYQNSCVRLDELPEPPSEKTGWPWTEESSRLPTRRPEGDSWPRLSVITPSFNQGQFIEETIRSILLQGYPNLEYFIMDGGSTDGSVEIIKKYSPWLSYWISQTDNGQSDAINQGLGLASGDLATWINSDDLLAKNALVEHASRIGFARDTVYVGNCIYIDKTSTVLSLHTGRVQSLEDLVRIKTVWNACGHIVQPEVLFPRELALSVGGVNPDNHFTMDYELWGRLFLVGATFRYTDIPFAMFREHSQQKTHDPPRITEWLVKTAAELIKVANCFSDEKKTELLADLGAYHAEYQRDYWKGTGRLARIGLPRRVVTYLRGLKAVLKIS
jgi:glycosyltransferase involved in cell wall biosynthesis